ncbi:MAG: nuclear transport factor 2 family protein [Betaproteobacteria bacterium]
MIAGLLAAPSVTHPPEARDRAALRALEREWLIGEHDRQTLDRVLAEDFMHPVAAGVFLTKGQHIKWAVAHPLPADRRQRFEQLKIRLYGDTGVVTGVVLSVDAVGHEDRTVFTDVFVRRHGRWQAVNAQETPVETSGRGRNQR